jgi:hypothetical protein
MMLQEICLKKNCFFAGGEEITATEYTGLGRVEEYKYGRELGNAFRGNNPIKYLQNFGMYKTYCKYSKSVNFVIQTFIKTNRYGQLNI